MVWFAEMAEEMGGEELQSAVDAMLPSGFLDGVSQSQRDEWRRATGSGVLGMDSMSHGGKPISMQVAM